MLMLPFSTVILHSYKYFWIFHFREETEKAPKSQRSGQTWKLCTKKLNILRIRINWIYFNKGYKLYTSQDVCQSWGYVWVEKALTFFWRSRHWELLTCFLLWAYSYRPVKLNFREKKNSTWPKGLSIQLQVAGIICIWIKIHHMID